MKRNLYLFYFFEHMNTNNANDFLNIISFSLPKKKKCYELMFVWASKLSVHTTFLKCSLGYCDMK